VNFDPEPLLRVVGAGVDVQDNVHDQHQAERPSIIVLARRLGVSPRTLHRWLAGQGVPFHHADRICTTLHLHPIQVWGIATYNLGVEADEEE